MAVTALVVLLHGCKRRFCTLCVFVARKVGVSSAGSLHRTLLGSIFCRPPGYGGPAARQQHPLQLHCTLTDALSERAQPRLLPLGGPLPSWLCCGCLALTQAVRVWPRLPG